MKISHLALRGVAALPDLECNLVSAATGRPHELVVVSGPPASGKTRLCEALLAALEVTGPYLGIVRASDWFADPARGARVELGIRLDDDERAFASASSPAQAVVHFGSNGVTAEVGRGVVRLLSRYDHDPAHGKREYFPEGRQRAWGAGSDGLGTLEQCILRTSKDTQKYAFVPRFLAELRSDPTRARVFSEGLERLSPTARYNVMNTAADPASRFSNLDGDGVRYVDLSSSEADAALISATVAMTGLCNSIVILDRPEMYVPASRLVAWVHSLAGLGQNNQWLIATSDARLVAGVDPSQRISLEPADHYPVPAASPSQRTS
jgi:hypothetical protein